MKARQIFTITIQRPDFPGAVEVLVVEAVSSAAALQAGITHAGQVQAAIQVEPLVLPAQEGAN